MTIARLGVLALVAMFAYGLLLAKNGYRHHKYHKRYDYWIAGYLFDRQRSMIRRIGMLMVWILALFVVLVFMDALLNSA